MRANNRKPYTPREGKMISDINKAWERLEKAEHERELALREELIRQEKLEQLATRFNRKASMRETWLSENQRLVSQVRRRRAKFIFYRATTNARVPILRLFRVCAGQLRFRPDRNGSGSEETRGDRDGHFRLRRKSTKCDLRLPRVGSRKVSRYR